MEQKQLEAKTLHAAIVNACIRLIEQKEKLNAINIFPVADGDTGDNMASTALSIVHHAEVKPNLAATLKSISDAAIAGARGNSGMIFSQFFNGLYKHFQEDAILDTKGFSHLVKHAAKTVRQSILNPIEGTILTMMDSWADQIETLAKVQNNFKTLMLASLSPLDSVLKKTEESLDVLKKAHLVDAGALGFYHFVKGFAEYLEKPEQAAKTYEIKHQDMDNHAHDEMTEAPEKRYCTEALIACDQIDEEAFKQLLSRYGDSIVLSTNGQLCRFHVHADNPAELFFSLGKLGKISMPKVDDMLRQYQMIHQRQHRIALVTDSSANLPQDLIDQHQIHVIPLQLYLDEHQLLDHYCLPRASLYDILGDLKQYPKTSLPNLAYVQAKLSAIAQHYDQVLVISLSEVLSGTYNVFLQAAADKDNIHVINSKHTAGSQGLIVKYAADCIQAGMSIETIKQKLRKKCDETYIYVMIDQFDSLIRSGRISKFSGRFAQLAHVKPIITMNSEGKVDIFEKTFGWKKGLNRMLEQALKLKQQGALLAYNVLHTNIPEEAEAFAAEATAILGQAPLFIDTASSAIGLHIGCGAIAISVMLETAEVCEPA